MNPVKCRSSRGQACHKNKDGRRVQSTFETKARTLLLAALILWVGGCASVDFEFPRQPSSAFAETGDTYLGRKVSELSAGKSGNQSAFSMLSDGIESLATRLLLVQRAEKSIDLQYYVIHVDRTGSALLRRLLEAADRGVRIRLLIDDYYAEGYDAGLAGLDSHPNFEVRVFNPFRRGGAGRKMTNLSNFGRVNRRMHNKTFIVDGQVAIIGGRNIGDEYFDAAEDTKFTDIDVLTVGPVVPELSAMFDTYWNHEVSLPVPAFANMPDSPAAELSRLRTKFETSRTEIFDSPYAKAVRQQKIEYIETDRRLLHWSDYELVFDHPDKSMSSRADEADSIRGPLIDALEGTNRELIVVSPYFVPRKSGIDRYQILKDRGVDVLVVTNSLASTNQKLVFSGYAPSRKKLLAMGVRLHEIRPDRDQSASGDVYTTEAQVAMHTKAFVVDGSQLFMGSFNFDPRSAYINTEGGIIIKSVAMASAFAKTVTGALPERTYELFIDDKDRLRWRTLNPDGEVIHDKEPETTWGQRFNAWWQGLLPIRAQL